MSDVDTVDILIISSSCMHLVVLVSRYLHTCDIRVEPGCLFVCICFFVCLGVYLFILGFTT